MSPSFFLHRFYCFVHLLRPSPSSISCHSFSFASFLQPTTTTDAKCSTISTVTDFCTHLGGNPTMEYDPSKAEATCGGTPCDKTSMPDQSACCKDVTYPKCSSVETQAGFCGAGKKYNMDNAESMCSGYPCTSGADVRCLATALFVVLPLLFVL